MNRSKWIHTFFLTTATGLLLSIPTVTLADRAHAWADKPSKNQYRPSANYAWNPSGGILIKRSATGRYQVNFQKFGRNAKGSHVQVGAYGSGATCNVLGWSHTAPDFTVKVACYNSSGGAVDSRFVVEASFPDTGAGVDAKKIIQLPSVSELQIQGGVTQGPSQPGQPVKRRVLKDGRVEVTYPDGKIVRTGPSGKEIIHPDGKVEKWVYSTAAPAATPPAPPNGSNLAQFLNSHSTNLLDSIRTLVGGDVASIENYLAGENEPNLYNQISKRSRVIRELLQ